MGIRSNQKILLAKVESTYGTDSTPNGSYAVDARNININYVGDVLERDTARQDISPSAPRIGKRKVEITFEVDLMGSGAAGVAPEFGDILQACAWSETIGGSNGSSIIYAPDGGGSSVTLYVYAPYSATSSVLVKITGCRGNVNFNFEAGKMTGMSFTLQGKYNTPTDVATITPTYQGESNSVLPPILDSAAFTFNGTGSLVVQQLQLEMGNELVDIDDFDTANTLKEIRIAKRRPSGRFNPEAVQVATYAWWTDWVNSSQRAIAFQIGSANYNKIAFAAPKVTLDGINDEDISGYQRRGIPIKFNRSAGNDEITLTFS